MEWLKSLDPVQIQAWLVLAMLVVGLVEAILHKRSEAQKLDEKERLAFYWSALRDLAPKAMLVVERGVRLTKSKKDDQFFEVIERMAKVIGIEIPKDDVDAVKDLGCAEKEEHKIREALLEEVPELPDYEEVEDDGEENRGTL